MDQGRDMTDATAAPEQVLPVRSAGATRDLVVDADPDPVPGSRLARSPPWHGSLADDRGPGVRNDQLVLL